MGAVGDAVLIALALLACPSPELPDHPGPRLESDALELWEARGVSVALRVVDEGGAPVAGAEVRAGQVRAIAVGPGEYHLEGLARANVLLQVEAEGHYPLAVPLVLALPEAVDAVEVDTLVLTPRRAGVTRFLFTGDTALGRRFLDPDQVTPRDQVPEDHSEAWIQVSSPEEGSRALVSRVRPYFDGADFPVLNLETPVTDDPSTPHWTKPYAFFTLPGSLVLLDELGISYVSLGNNHVYDYLQPGLDDTMRHLDAAGVAHSGAGATPEEAAAPWVVELDGHEYAFLSFTSIAGDEHEIVYVATDAQGGAADLRDDALVDAAYEGVASAARIALLHVGSEYYRAPSEYTLGWFDEAVDRGAALVVGHHPHVTQGFDRVDGVLVTHCLGNFVLDQDRLETFPALLLQADMEGAVLHRARAIPVLADSYQPLPVGGERAARLARNVAEVSGVAVVLHAGQLWLLDPDDPRITVEEREVEIPVEVDDRGWAVVDGRQWLDPDESLAAVRIEDLDATALSAGRDLMDYGGFEDHDVDDDTLEGDRWDLEGASRAACVTGALRGAAGLCSWRSADNLDPSVTPFRNRLRPPIDADGVPDRDLSLLAWARLEGAGPARFEVKWMASVGTGRFGEESHPLGEGDADWHLWSADLAMPADAVEDPADDQRNPRALRVFLHHEVPEEGHGTVYLDDAAVVVWDRELDPGGGALDAPHGRDFLRVEASPGKGTVVVTVRRWTLEP